MTTALVHYAAAALTDRGRKRSSNEDAFGISPEHGVYVVCDGMGGAAAGEVASAMAVDELMRLLTAGSRPGPEEAERAIEAVNEAIQSRARRNPRFSGMGTTMVALLVEGRHAWMLNVGDSRGYRLRHKQIEQITRDHSLIEEQVSLGRMSRADAERSPLRNVITRALGTQVSVSPDTFTLEAEPGDLYLLCSDGLTRELSDKAIESLLANNLPLDRLCEQLIGAANKAGGHDNITCVLVRVED